MSPVSKVVVPPPVSAMPQHAARHFSTWALAAAILMVATAALAYWYVISRGEVASNAPKKVGILSFRQFNDVTSGFKAEIMRLGYEDAQYIERLAVPGPTMMDDIRAHVREMIAQDVDAIWASLEMQAKTAVEITKETGRTDIPIVFLARFHDPVEYGVIESFQSSGNNATGVVTNLQEIVQRSLEFFKEINPDFKRLGVFTDGFLVADIGGEILVEVNKQAPNFGMEIIEYKTNVPPPEAETEFNRIAAGMEKGEIDGLYHIPGHFYGMQEEGEGKLAIRLGIPMVAPYEDLPNGGLFSYSDDFGESGRQSAGILDQIFKGTKPADIPVRYGANNILTLMSGRAREAGVTFPDSMLFIAKNIYDDNSAFETESKVHE